METITKTAGLSPARRRLVELMQKVRFGRIEKLQVRDGEPILDPPPPARRLVVFGKKNTPRASREGADFDLKKQVKELFDLFDSEGTFLIEGPVPTSVEKGNGVISGSYQRPRPEWAKTGGLRHDPAYHA